MTAVARDEDEHAEGPDGVDAASVDAASGGGEVAGGGACGTEGQVNQDQHSCAGEGLRLATQQGRACHKNSEHRQEDRKLHLKCTWRRTLMAQGMSVQSAPVQSCEMRGLQRGASQGVSGPCLVGPRTGMNTSGRLMHLRVAVRVQYPIGRASVHVFALVRLFVCLFDCFSTGRHQTVNVNVI